jgi:hypothetical protein
MCTSGTLVEERGEEERQEEREERELTIRNKCRYKAIQEILGKFLQTERERDRERKRETETVVCARARLRACRVRSEFVHVAVSY